MNMIDVVKVYETGQAKSKTIVIPKEIAELAGIKAGDRLLIELKGGELRLRKVE